MGVETVTQYVPNLKTKYLRQRQPRTRLMPPALAKQARYTLAGTETILQQTIARIEKAAALQHVPAPAVGHLRTAIMHIHRALDELPALRERNSRQTTGYGGSHE